MREWQSLSLFSLSLHLSLFGCTAHFIRLFSGGLFCCCLYFFAICKWFSAFRFCFSAIYFIVSHFYFPCENCQRRTESTEQEVLRGGKNGYFVVLFHFGYFLVVARCLRFCDGLWFGCLGGWLMCRIVFDIYLCFMHFFPRFSLRFILTRGCLQGVNCSTRLLHHIFWL